MRGVTRFGIILDLDVIISTRTPHAGSDFRYRISRRRRSISTRTPHAGSDLFTASSYVFQPALPMRGVT